MFPCSSKPATMALLVGQRMYVGRWMRCFVGGYGAVWVDEVFCGWIRCSVGGYGAVWVNEVFCGWIWCSVGG